MKKIIIAFAALAAAFSLVSCNKEQIETPSTDLKLNIKVANLDGSADTKAAKTAWVAGDKINMWFDDWNYTEQAENHTPDIIIRYNGSAWVIESEAEGLDARLKAEGKLSAIYEGFNDLSKYTYQWWGSSEWFKALGSPLSSGKIFPLLSPSILNKKVPELMAAAGITKHITFHCFRHTFAMRLLDRNVDLPSIASFLGHKYIGSALSYVHSSRERLEEIIKKLER